MNDPLPAGRRRAAPIVDFCGRRLVVANDPFTIGRVADLVIEDDNRFLHRRFLTLTSSHRSLWLLANVGSRLTATVCDAEARVEAFLAPGAVMPLVFDESIVRFVAGPTSYELAIVLSDPVFETHDPDEPDTGDPTIGRPLMTPDQLRLILALAEPRLRSPGRTITMPTSQAAARRLGWTMTKFNRKLDNVCQKLASLGIGGLHGAPGRLASNRRSRLVEYAIAMRLVTRDDLCLLEPLGDDAV